MLSGEKRPAIRQAMWSKISAANSYARLNNTKDTDAQQSGFPESFF